MERSAFALAGDRISAAGFAGGRLIHRATAGEATHSATKGIAAGSARGCTSATATAATIASKTPPDIRTNTAYIFRLAAERDCAAVTHSNKFLRVIRSRANVRTIASDISHAW